MINLSFIMFLLVLMFVVSLITALVIEAVKKVYGEESIKRAFKSLEIFSLIFTMIVSVYVYIIFLLFTITEIPSLIETIKLVVSGILFIISCSCGSQVGYDKVIKTIKDIIVLVGGTNAIQ